MLGETIHKVMCAYDKIQEILSITPNPKNPNKHPENQIERLAKIIDFQGQRSPIVISTRSGFVVKGHGRLEAIKLLGWTHAAVDYQDYENEAQEWADIVADNAIASWAELDLDMIKFEMMELPDLPIEMLGIEDFKLEPVSMDGELPSIGSGDRDHIRVSFLLHNSQNDSLSEALRIVEEKYKVESENELNENKNGNYLGFILESFIQMERKK